MKLLRAFVLSLPLLAAPALYAGDADACGGCTVVQSENTQVTGHRMILSISNDRTTLYDQITYAGNPSSFAWILPIKGEVDVGLSSDAVFNALEQATQISVVSPSINCLPPGCAGAPNAGGDFDNAGSGGAGGGGVEVIAEEVVGPYATVQLSSQDPNALANWLLSNGYYVPPDIKPVIDAYVNEGFNFLALKLVPGEGVNSMRPVRISSLGAQPTLPLRMVAAGTGAITPITLWILGEGRYEPTNFPSFQIKAQDLVWNWDTQSSNYTDLKKKSFDASGGKAWLIEAGQPFSRYWIEDNLKWTAQNDPENSGYGGDPMGPSALDECVEDLDTLFGSIPENTLWLTRIHAELSRPALATDLTLGASADQSHVERWLQVENAIGTPPACPPPPDWCFDQDMPDVNPWDNGVGVGADDPNAGTKSNASCAIRGEASMPATLGLLGGALVLSVARRRRRR
ncbi:DUF2330 domain-containing protein [Polyangium spumosum]|uniref:DUF2330 domain-containing protein n=1 Tax=Polyangium spumosum TaxID=889282 RepID=A0A6N7PV02_9BACT|nr:DUF2330 domain-containing protein [Polyangium spumosum]MRG95739.1 DUF2330 domain-containing protein [Polyangium spumosum]